MAVREFTDEHGKRWRAWDIHPDAIRPKTRAEDYLAACYDVGWIVFESLTGDQKRRLCPYPSRWAEVAVFELREMLARAEIVPPRKLAVERQVGGELSIAAQPADVATAPGVGARGDADEWDVTDLEVVRSFRYPGGRLWTVCVVQRPEVNESPVLRFTAGARHLDLKTWPRDWADATDEILAALLRLSAPRQPNGPPALDTPRRRWDDVR